MFSSSSKGLVRTNILRRLKSTLVVAEHNNETLNPVTLNTISAAKKIAGDDVTVLVAGTKCGSVSCQSINFNQTSFVFEFLLIGLRCFG